MMSSRDYHPLCQLKRERSTSLIASLAIVSHKAPVWLPAVIVLLLTTNLYSITIPACSIDKCFLQGRFRSTATVIRLSLRQMCPCHVGQASLLYWFSIMILLKAYRAQHCVVLTTEVAHFHNISGRGTEFRLLDFHPSQTEFLDSASLCPKPSRIRPRERSAYAKGVI